MDEYGHADEHDRELLFGSHAGGWTVTAVSYRDYEPDPRTDGDWATPEDVQAWRDDRWVYLTVSAVVALDGVTIADEAIGAVVHGQGPEGEDGTPRWSAKAFELIPGRLDGDVHVAGSTLWDVVTEAVESAGTWVRERLGVDPWDTSMAELLRWDALKVINDTDEAAVPYEVTWIVRETTTYRATVCGDDLNITSDAIRNRGGGMAGFRAVLMDDDDDHLRTLATELTTGQEIRHDGDVEIVAVTEVQA